MSHVGRNAIPESNRAATHQTPRPAAAQASTVAARERADNQADTRSMLTTVAILGSALALAATAQAIILVGTNNLSTDPVSPIWETGRRVLINGTTVVTSLLVVRQLRIETRRPLPAAGLVLAAGIILALIRALLQLVVGIYSQHNIVPALADAALAGSMISLIIAFALVVVRMQQRVRADERKALLPMVRSTSALARTLRRQISGRHTLATDLRDALSNRFVRLIDEMADVTQDTDGLVRMRMRVLGSELEDLATAGREGLAVFAHPEALEHGLVAAVRAFISMVPGTIEMRLRVDDSEAVLAATGSGRSGLDRRAMLLQAVADAIMDALEYDHAELIVIEMGVVGGMMRITVTDDGAHGRAIGANHGLDRLRVHASQLGGALTTDAPREGGFRVVFRVPPTPPSSP